MRGSPQPTTKPVLFYVGLYNLPDAGHFDRVFISVNCVRTRKKLFPVNDWIMDSGAFSEISRFGNYRSEPSAYADVIRRWAGHGNLLAAVAQDWMCEPFILKKTGLTVREHQERTVARYDALVGEGAPVYIMPVLQGYYAYEYTDCLKLYGDRIKENAYVGVGSLCKRNATPQAVLHILQAIKAERPDLRLHGFGVKITALSLAGVRHLLYSSDSMAWGFEAVYTGLDTWKGSDFNNWHLAKKFEERVLDILKHPSQQAPPPLWAGL